MVTGVRRGDGGSLFTTAGSSALDRVASCNRIAEVLPVPSDGLPGRRCADVPHCGQICSSGIAAMGNRAVKSGQSCSHRNE